MAFHLAIYGFLYIKARESQLRVFTVSYSLTKYFKLQRLRDTARHQNILYAMDLMISFFNFTYIEIFYSVKVVIFEVASQT